MCGESMTEWVGFGCFIRHGIHPYFLLVELTPSIIQGLKRIMEQAQGIDGEDGLENVILSASAAYVDEADYNVFVVPASDWKLIGKDAAMHMWQENQVLIRVSTDHAQYMKLASIDMSPGLSFETKSDDTSFDICVQLCDDDDDVSMLYATNALFKEWIEHWAEHGVAGSHGQTIADAIAAPQAPPVSAPQQEGAGRSENTNPPLPPQPIVPVAEEEEDCVSCGESFPLSLLRDDICPQCGAECEVCNEFFDREDMVDDDRVCEDCAHHCRHCNEYFHSNSLVDDLCHDCRESSFTQCAACSRFIDNDEMLDDVCEDCAVLCKHCEDSYAPSRINSDGFCESCADAVAKCVTCGEFRSKDQMSEDGACEDCSVACCFCDTLHAPANLSDDICGDCMVTTAHCADCGERCAMVELNAAMLCANCQTAVTQSVVQTPAPNPRRRRR